MYTKKNLAIPVFFAVSLWLLISLACGSSPVVSTRPSSTAIIGQAANTSVPLNTPIPIITPVPMLTDTSFPPTATQNPNLIEPGTHLIGTDIQPGIYEGNAGADVSTSCYWERLKDLSGSNDAILANDNSVGQFYVEIKTSDYAFTTDCEIVPLDSLPARTGDFPQTIDPGTYLVGKDIQSGLYKGQAGSDVTLSCYWARLNNVSGGFDAIIANDNATGQYFVQVAASDFALATGCELQRVGK